MDRTEINRKAKIRKHLALMGRPCTVDAAPTIKRIRALHDLGMTSRQIADEAGVSQSTISDLYRGRRAKRAQANPPITRIPRTTQDAVFRVKPDHSSAHTSRALVDGTGTRRRLRALLMQGFSYRWLSEALDLKDWTMAYELATDEKRLVQVRTRTRVKELYAKLDGVDPVDVGMHPQAASRARGTARRHGYAPRGAWDEDTLDDPRMTPEWTGKCGTLNGQAIHVREMIPVCDQCITAQRLHRRYPQLSYLMGVAKPRGEAVWAEVREALEDGATIHEAADRIGVSTKTVERVKARMVNGGE